MCKIRVFLPKKYDLVVGDTFQLFYRGVVEAPNPYVYSIVVVCEKGKAFPRYYEYTPTEVGEHKLSVSVYDAEQNLLGYDETILSVVEPQAPKKQVNILCIGDSITNGGEWVNEVNRRITKNDGTPKGLDFENAVNFVGNCKRGEVGFEAFGGWSWHTFTSNAEGAMWIESPNNRTEADQHSLWKDENGAIWQLETLQIDYLKFNRYEGHTSPRPEGGVLTHYKNAVNVEPIEIKSSYTEKSSPFLDKESKKIDIISYMKRSNIEKIDVVYILLGCNGRMRTFAQKMSNEDYAKHVVMEGKVLVDKLKNELPNVKVKILSYGLPSPDGGVGANYGADLPLTNRYGHMQCFHTELNKVYQEWCLEDGYKDFMEFINLTGQFDCENAYPYINKPVNTRSEVVEKQDINAMHPTMVGYMQMADAVYRNLVKELKNF